MVLFVVGHFVGPVISTTGVRTGAAVPGGDTGCHSVLAIPIRRLASGDVGNHLGRTGGQVKHNHSTAGVGNEQSFAIRCYLYPARAGEWVHAVAAGGAALSAGETTEVTAGAEAGNMKACGPAAKPGRIAQCGDGEGYAGIAGAGRELKRVTGGNGVIAA